MSPRPVEDHFILNRWILRGAGLWAPDTSSKCIRKIFYSYSVLVILFVNIYFTPTEFISIKDTYKNLNTLIKNLSFGLTHLLGAIKVAFWYYRNKELRHIIGILESKDYRYESEGDFQPNLIFQKAKRTGLKYTFAFYLMAHLTVSSSYIPPIITAFSYQANGNSTFNQPLPYFSWIPFNYDTPKSYIFALAYQMGPMYSYAYSIVGMDTLFMNILNLTGAHMSVLKEAFRSLKNRCKHGYVTNKNTLEIIMAQEYRRCVNHMQTIFRICDDLERIYKYLTLVQVLFTLFIFCTCLFLVSTTPVTSKHFISEIVYMVAMGFQLILYCWFGNEVTLKASEIPDAHWESDWLDTSHTFRTNMLITMIRMRRPLHLTVGKFAPLTLSTFVTILRGSYSFFAVLKHVND